MRTVQCGHATHPGRIRDHNEDSYSADPEKGFFIIADGVGGQAAGEVASAIVVRSVRQDVSKGLDLEEALIAAHNNVLKAVSNGIGRPGMGATAVALKVTEAGYQIGWVGDSRAYLWNGRLKQITRDHSFVQRMMDFGVMTEEEARVHPKRNILTQALGAEKIPELKVGMIYGHLSRGQKLLLCSDGLTGELEDEEIAAILARFPADQACVSALIQAANDHAGKDNVSVILVSLASGVSESADEEDDTLPQDINRIAEMAERKDS